MRFVLKVCKFVTFVLINIFDAVNSTWLVMASRIEMVELIKGFVVNFELLLNVKLIVGTTFLINGHGLNY